MALIGDEGIMPRDVLIALTYGLELVRNGAMLVASDGCTHLANRAARAILLKQDGLSLSRTGLIADRASDTRLLLKLLEEAIIAPERGEPKVRPSLCLEKRLTAPLSCGSFQGPG